MNDNVIAQGAVGLDEPLTSVAFDDLGKVDRTQDNVQIAPFVIVRKAVVLLPRIKMQHYI